MDWMQLRKLSKGTVFKTAKDLEFDFGVLPKSTQISLQDIDELITMESLIEWNKVTYADLGYCNAHFIILNGDFAGEDIVLDGNSLDLIE